VAGEAAAGAVEDLLPPCCEVVGADPWHPDDDTGIQTYVRLGKDVSISSPEIVGSRG
jgi:hypothetical protein